MTRYAEGGSAPPHLIEPGDPPAVALLKEDHQMIRALFDLAETVEPDMLFPVAGEVCIRLAIHMMIEEEIFYPALKPVVGVDEIDEAIVEHQIARQLISEIMEMTGREELFKSKIHVLGEMTIHHIDEEDREILRRARKAWEQGRIDLVELGQRMYERRRELHDLIGMAGPDTRNLEIEPVGDTIEELPSRHAEQYADAVSPRRVRADD
jgi:hypothetical protein